jgi:hypothetical protein
MIESATALLVATTVIFVVMLSRALSVPPAIRRWGPLDESLQCPKCGEAGGVHTRTVHRKAGLSNGKVMAAMLTGGLALLMVGMHKHIEGRESHCMRCEATWDPETQEADLARTEP